MQTLSGETIRRTLIFVCLLLMGLIFQLMWTLEEDNEQQDVRILNQIHVLQTRLGRLERQLQGSGQPAPAPAAALPPAPVESPAAGAAPEVPSPR